MFKKKTESFKKFVGNYIYNQIQKGEKSICNIGFNDENLTILVVDVLSMDFLSENLNPFSLTHALNTYIKNTFEIIEKNNGEIINLSGDTIMAVFGLNGGNHYDDACITAIEIKKGQDEINNEDLVIPIVIGINSGFVSVGNIGTESRLFFSVLGDAVNLSYRLSQSNMMYQTQILISEYVEKELEKYFIRRSVDSIKVEFKQNPVEIFELIEIER